MTSSERSHPLRPYYTPSDDDVAFVATAPARYATGNASSSPGVAASAAVGSGGGSSSSVRTPLPPANRYATAEDEALGQAAGLGEGGLTDWARVMALSAAFQYTSTCLAMPFEVGKLLLQIQWVPRDEVWVAFGEAEREKEMTALARPLTSGRTTGTGRSKIGRNEWNEGEASNDLDGEDEDDDDESEDYSGSAEWEGIGKRPRGRDFGAEGDELSDEEDAEAYFRDLSNQPGRTVDDDDDAAARRRRRRKRTDASGYVMRRSIHEDVTRPEFVMPVVVRGGVWEMIKAVGRGKEGWLGLWKGSLTTYFMDTATSTIQPIVSFVLSFVAPSALTPLPLPYAPHPYRSLALLLSSHLITGIIVSPLDLVRTRLIAQSTLPPHRKYTSPWNALHQILTEEGGWRTTYFHPNLFIPTLLDFTIRPLLSLSTPLIIEHKLRLDPLASPITYSLAEFGISSASLLIMLPIETIRRRLQLQARAAWGKKIAKVHGSRPKPNHRNSLSTVVTDAAADAQPRDPALPSPRRDIGNTSFASATGAIPQPVFSKPLRTCVETRPRPYEGVSEAIYRILTEETSTSPVKKIIPGKGKGSKKDATEAASTAARAQMMDSGILAKPGSSSFGGLYSLYRGLGFSLGANALVFVLTIVSGERAHATAGWTEI